MLQGGQDLLLHPQGRLVHFSLSQQLLRIRRGEVHRGGVQNIGLQRMQTPTRLLYLQKTHHKGKFIHMRGSLGKFW